MLTVAAAPASRGHKTIISHNTTVVDIAVQVGKEAGHMAVFMAERAHIQRRPHIGHLITIGPNIVCPIHPLVGNGPAVRPKSQGPPRRTGPGIIDIDRVDIPGGVTAQMRKVEPLRHQDVQGGNYQFLSGGIPPRAFLVIVVIGLRFRHPHIGRDRIAEIQLSVGLNPVILVNRARIAKFCISGRLVAVIVYLGLCDSPRLVRKIHQNTQAHEIPDRGSFRRSG